MGEVRKHAHQQLAVQLCRVFEAPLILEKLRCTEATVFPGIFSISPRRHAHKRAPTMVAVSATEG